MTDPKDLLISKVAEIATKNLQLQTVFNQVLGNFIPTMEAHVKTLENEAKADMEALIAKAKHFMALDLSGVVASTVPVPTDGASPTTVAPLQVVLPEHVVVKEDSVDVNMSAVTEKSPQEIAAVSSDAVVSGIETDKPVNP